MQRVRLAEVEIDYEVIGTGEPVLLIHGAHIADAMRPLAAEPALEGCQRIVYHRRGFAGSTKVPGVGTMDAQVGDAIGLLDHLGIDRAHVVGHSAGGAVAMALAAARPDRTRSLAILETAILDGSNGEMFRAVVSPMVEQYEQGDAAGAVGSFLALIGDADWRDIIERTVPGGVDQAENDAATFFESELPASASWSFGPTDAARVTCPVAYVLGTASSPLFVEARARIHQLFPRCVDIDIPDANHLLQMQHPAAVARELAAFFVR